MQFEILKFDENIIFTQHSTQAKTEALRTSDSCVRKSNSPYLIAMKRTINI